MIRFACPRCGMQLSAPKECAGRSSKCRACGQAVTVPATQPVGTKHRKLILAGIGVGLCAGLVLAGCCAVSVAFWVLGATKRPAVPATEDESSIPASTENRIDLSDVDETARLMKSRCVDLKRRHQSNPIRLADEIASANKDLAQYVGKDVRWTFTVSGISPRVPLGAGADGKAAPDFPGAVDVYNEWKTTDGSRMPIDEGQGIVMARIVTGGFSVAWGNKYFTGDSASLVIGEEIPKVVAADLKPGDRLVITGTIDSLEFGYGPSCSCVLRDVRAKKE